MELTDPLALYLRNRARRVRGMVWASSARTLVLAASLLLVPDRFRAPVYDPMFDLLPRYVWAGLLALSAVLCCVGMVSHRTAPTRVALVASASLMAMIAAAFAIAAFIFGTGTLWATAAFGNLALIDAWLAGTPAMGHHRE